jgi:hypothetical protein
MNPKPKRAAQTLPTNPGRIRDFIQALLNDKAPPEAAATAGYAPSAWRRLIRRPDVVAAIAAENNYRDRVASHTQARVQDQMGNLAFSDIADVLNDDGTPKPISQIPPHARAAIRSWRTGFYTDANGVSYVRSRQIELEPKQPSLSALGKITCLTDDDGSVHYNGMGFEVNIHLGPGSIRNVAPAPAARPVEVESKPLLETTNQPAPSDEKGN